MLKSFTRNYQDNSTDAGFQFTFYCDICNDGYKTSFIESTTYKKKKGTQMLGQGVSILGNLMGGTMRNVAYNAERGGNILAERFEGKSPDWQREHEWAFERAQNEAQQHFHRCHACNKYVCDACFNEDEGLCTGCAPRQEIYVARKRAEAMKRNIDEEAQTATVWKGAIESKTTICPECGKPTGAGKFCNNCGTSLDLNICTRCGAKNAQAVRFCNNCGNPMSAQAASSGTCPNCGKENAPGTKFCGGCGTKIG